jgi:hypothetical protein
MSSIPLPALSIRPPENPLDQYAKALSVKSMIQGQQIGEQQLQQEKVKTQETQIGLKDMQARSAAMSQWDGKDPNNLADLIRQNGGSYDAVYAAKKQGLDLQQLYSKIALDDSTTGKNSLDVIKGQHDQVAGALESLVDPKAVPDDQLHNEATKTLNGLLADKVLDRDHGQQLQEQIDQTKDPNALRQGIDHYAKMHMGASEAAALAKSQAESGKAVAEANLENQKLKIYTSSKPGDFDAQIDSLIPPTANNPNADLNKQAKTMVNGLLARGDYEGAAKSLENAQHVLNERMQTNYVQGREDMRAANQRAANQDNQLQKNAIEQLDKVWTDPQHGYTQFLAQANATRSAISSAKNGNELAASLAPLMTVLGVNSFAGVHRINPQEYEAAGPGVGSIYRHINTTLDKAVSGKLNPDTANEMNSLVGQLIEQKYSSLLPASQLIVRNAPGLDATKVTIFDKDGNPNTLDNAAKGIVAPKSGGSTNTTIQVPENVMKALSSVGTGRHTLSDGSVWDKHADGTILKAQ